MVRIARHITGKGEEGCCLNPCPGSVDIMKRLLLVVLLIQACIIGAVCDADPDLRSRPITNPTQRVEFDGFSILPPRAKGWIRLEQPPQIGPNWTAKAYFIKRLKEEVEYLVRSSLRRTF